MSLYSVKTHTHTHYTPHGPNELQLESESELEFTTDNSQSVMMVVVELGFNLGLVSFPISSSFVLAACKLTRHGFIDVT